MSTEPCPEARRRLRQEMRAARAAFAAALRPEVRMALARAIAARVVPHLPSGPAVLGTFAPLPGEPDPAPVAEAARALGWRIAYPRVAGPEAPLSFHLADLRELAPGFRAIPEPGAHLPAVTPSVLLVPLLAADPAGNRLGQGGGHYDRTLAALRARGPLVAIGLAWDLQIVPAVDRLAFDQPLDAIATPTRFLRPIPDPR